MCALDLAPLHLPSAGDFGELGGRLLEPFPSTDFRAFRGLARPTCFGFTARACFCTCACLGADFAARSNARTRIQLTARTVSPRYPVDFGSALVAFAAGALPPPPPPPPLFEVVVVEVLVSVDVEPVVEPVLVESLSLIHI